MQRLLPLLAFALAACATVPADSAGPTAGLRQAAHVGGLRIRPVAIVEDSRCPKNVQCVWAGRLVIEAEIDFNGGSETYRGQMTLGEPLDLGRESVTLIAAPEKLAGAPANPRAYRFTFAAGPKP